MKLLVRPIAYFRNQLAETLGLILGNGTSQTPVNQQPAERHDKGLDFQFGNQQAMPQPQQTGQQQHQ